MFRSFKEDLASLDYYQVLLNNEQKKSKKVMLSDGTFNCNWQEMGFATAGIREQLLKRSKLMRNFAFRTLEIPLTNR